MRVIRDTMLGLSIGNGARLSWFRGDHAAKVGDMAAQVVGDALVMIGGVDAWPRNGPVTVGRHLVPFLETIQKQGINH